MVITVNRFTINELVLPPFAGLLSSINGHFLSISTNLHLVIGNIRQYSSYSPDTSPHKNQEGQPCIDDEDCKPTTIITRFMPHH